MQHSYGSCPADDAAAAAPRDVARGVRGFVVVAAAAAVLGVLCVQGLLSAGAERATLMDKQQAAWWGAPHKDRNGEWHRGWLARYVARRGRGARPEEQQLAAARGAGGGDELAQIHELLDTAMGMLGRVEGGRAQQVLAGGELSAASQKRLTAVKAEADSVTPGEGEQPQCFKLNHLTDPGRAHALRRMSEAADNLVGAYPSWATAQSIPGTAQDGEWNNERGPPYVQRLTMYAGQGVDTLHNGNLVRRVLGLDKAFQTPCDLRSCDKAFSGNEYVRSFDGSQFRFLYRNLCSAVVVPPLTKGAGPILGHDGLYRLHHYIKDGYNTLVVLGGTANVLFLNQNVATVDGGFSLQPSWVDGPFEAQAAQSANTPFAALSVTLPNPGVSVTGVKISSLPTNAISYFEAEDTSVVFEIPLGTGRIIYLGYDYSEPVVPWVHALVAATMFNDFNFEGPPPRGHAH